MTTVTPADIERTRLETLQHIHEVRWRLCVVACQLITRAHTHDASKLVEPELSGFAALTANLAQIEYGTPEYRQALADAAEVVEHHYAHNDHHPPRGGIRDMNLLQIMEMLCDWAAASGRTKGGTIWRSLEINRERFGLSDDLYQILANTVTALGLDNPTDAPAMPERPAQPA